MITLQWRKVTESLPDGWYWWRCGSPFERPDDYEVLQVANGYIVDVRPVDSYGATWEQYEHTDFSGYWAGPIDPPLPLDPRP